MRALVLLFAAGCAYESYSLPDEPEPVDLVPDAGVTTPPSPDADLSTPPPQPPDADVPPAPEPDADLPRADFGEPCVTDADCVGGICHQFDSEWLCTQPCSSPEDCPERRSCDDEGYCRMDWDEGGGGGGGGGG